MDHETPIYQTGIKGWWKFAYRYSPRGADKREFIQDFLRRVRPSARLRQCEQERIYWKAGYGMLEDMIGGPE